MRLVVKLTAGERGRVGSLAEAAGVSVSDYVRWRALDQQPEPGLLEQTAVVPVREERGATARELRNVPEPRPVLHRCPKFAGCGFQAPSVKARCPIHGCTVKP